MKKTNNFLNNQRYILGEKEKKYLIADITIQLYVRKYREKILVFSIPGLFILLILLNIITSLFGFGHESDSLWMMFIILYSIGVFFFMILPDPFLFFIKKPSIELFNIYKKKIVGIYQSDNKTFINHNIKKEGLYFSDEFYQVYKK